MTQAKSLVLGQRIAEFPGELDSIPLPIGTQRVVYTSDEVVARCPVTHQPDFYRVEIVLESSEVGIESKSLKLYLQSFWNRGIFAEQLAYEIAKQILGDLLPDAVTVTTSQKSRGGISIAATVRLTIEGFEPEED